MHAIDRESRRPGWLQSVYPLCKLLVTLAYLMVLLSFGKYHLAGILLMACYLVVCFIASGISVNLLLRRLWFILLLVAFVGLPNVFIDHQPMLQVGSVVVTGGMLSMTTLFLKGVFAVAGAYLLMVTTPMETICRALRQLHVPVVIVTVFMLVHRYLLVLLKEVERITCAYSLRAPGQRGVHFKVWGTMVGQLLLRSIDCAQMVYESMSLRGFDGEFFFSQERKACRFDWIYTLGWIVSFLIIRFL